MSPKEKPKLHSNNPLVWNPHVWKYKPTQSSMRGLMNWETPVKETSSSPPKTSPFTSPAPSPTYSLPHSPHQFIHYSHNSSFHPPLHSSCSSLPIEWVINWLINPISVLNAFL